MPRYWVKTAFFLPRSYRKRLSWTTFIKQGDFLKQILPETGIEITDECLDKNDLLFYDGGVKNGLIRKLCTCKTQNRPFFCRIERRKSL